MSDPELIGPTVMSVVTDLAVQSRREWADRLIRPCLAPIPTYGSVEWHALPAHRPEKMAAAIRAAECWASDDDNLEENLRVEIEEMRRAHKVIDDEEFAARRDAHRAEQERTSYRPHPSNRPDGAA